MSWWQAFDPFTAFRRMTHLLAMERLRPPPLLPDDEGSLPPEADLSEDERVAALQREVVRREHEQTELAIKGRE